MKEGRKEGRTDGRKKGRTDGRTVERKNSLGEAPLEGARSERRTRMDGR